MRRVSPWWGPVPIIAALAYEAWSILQLQRPQGAVAYVGLMGAVASAVLLFGGWSRQHWVWAGVIAFVTVCILGLPHSAFVYWLSELSGTPPERLQSGGGVLTALAVPAGLIAGIASAYVCVKQWLRR